MKYRWNRCVYMLGCVQVMFFFFLVTLDSMQKSKKHSSVQHSAQRSPKGLGTVWGIKISSSEFLRQGGGGGVLWYLC